MAIFTEADYAHWDEHGYVVKENLLPETDRAAIAAGLREAMPPTDSYGPDGPPAHSATITFPFPNLAMNRMFANPDLLSFARRVLGTEQIFYNPGYSITRYPGAKLATNQGWHIDNGNNSLLPEAEDRTYGQVVVWYWPEGVRDGDAELCIIPAPHGNNVEKKVPLVCKPNTVTIFYNYIWHSGMDFRNTDGQRYSHAGMFGRADHPWEGLTHFTEKGGRPLFQEFIGSLTPAEREVFRFPPVGHPYYTETTLKRLEKQYPGWDASGAYASALTTG